MYTINSNIIPTRTELSEIIFAHLEIRSFRYRYRLQSFRQNDKQEASKRGEGRAEMKLEGDARREAQVIDKRNEKDRWKEEEPRDAQSTVHGSKRGGKSIESLEEGTALEREERNPARSARRREKERERAMVAAIGSVGERKKGIGENRQGTEKKISLPSLLEGGGNYAIDS